jgi:hypothetical protein
MHNCGQIKKQDSMQKVFSPDLKDPAKSRLYAVGEFPFLSVWTQRYQLTISYEV